MLEIFKNIGGHISCIIFPWSLIY